jgi:large subunit ribosomal protein L17
MRHLRRAKKLGRTTAHRAALRRNLITAVLIAKDLRIITTKAKAKFVKPDLEKIITLGRKKTLERYRRAISAIQNEAAVARLFNEIGPSFEKSGRPGGYTRIFKLAPRRLGDGGAQALLEIIKEGEKAAGAKKKRKASAKKQKKAR